MLDRRDLLKSAALLVVPGNIIPNEVIPSYVYVWNNCGDQDAPAAPWTTDPDPHYRRDVLPYGGNDKQFVLLNGALLNEKTLDYPIVRLQTGTRGWVDTVEYDEEGGFRVRDSRIVINRLYGVVEYVNLTKPTD